MGSSDGSGGAAQGAMQTSLDNQALAAKGINAGVGSLNTQAGLFGAPLASTANGITGAVQASSPGYSSGLRTALNTGGNLSGQTGINQNQLGQQFTGYASNTGNTNLAKANPSLTGFYNTEMTQGINPMTQLNAQNQLNQQFQQTNQSILSNQAPGMNPAAQQQQAQDALLQNSTNLAGSLAGQNQQYMQQGAQGLASTASNLDTQALNMLQQALTSGEGLNTQTLTNLINVLGLGSGALNQGLTSASQGIGATESANSALGTMFSGYGGQAQQFGQQASANAQSSGLGGILGSAAGLFSPIKI